MTNWALEKSSGSCVKYKKWSSFCARWKKITSRRWKRNHYVEKAVNVVVGDSVRKDSVVSGSTSMELDLQRSIVDVKVLATVTLDEGIPLPKTEVIPETQTLRYSTRQKGTEFWRKSTEDGLLHFRICREGTTRAQTDVRALRERVALIQEQLACAKATLASVESSLQDCKWEALDRDSWNQLLNMKVRPATNLNSQQLILENLRFLDEMQYFIAWCFEF